MTRLCTDDFYPRPPRGGRLLSKAKKELEKEISIHALREEGDPLRQPESFLLGISIHALREEGDLDSMADGKVYLEISIHALREEGDSMVAASMFVHPKISIHALREEGDCLEQCQECIDDSDFYPRPPRGGRPKAYVAGAVGRSFLSTPSARRATGFIRFFSQRIPISIHALREEGDPRLPPAPPTAMYFYPRPPRGGRLFTGGIPARLAEFLSTPSARRATDPEYEKIARSIISIHALREEGDRSGSRSSRRSTPNFYPRPPRGGRPSGRRTRAP